MDWDNFGWSFFTLAELQDRQFCNCCPGSRIAQESLVRATGAHLPYTREKDTWHEFASVIVQLSFSSRE
jgi:hypothetical protein